jgi:hypothetical protein
MHIIMCNILFYVVDYETIRKFQNGQKTLGLGYKEFVRPTLVI